MCRPPRPYTMYMGVYICRLSSTARRHEATFIAIIIRRTVCSTKYVKFQSNLCITFCHLHLDKTESEPCDISCVIRKPYIFDAFEAANTRSASQTTHTDHALAADMTRYFVRFTLIDAVRLQSLLQSRRLTVSLTHCSVLYQTTQFTVLSAESIPVEFLNYSRHKIAHRKITIKFRLI